MSEKTFDNVRLNDAFIALNLAEDEVDEVRNPEKLDDVIAHLDATSNDELRELIEEWEEGTLPREGSYKMAAKQLREIVEK